jgi:hypothetical protein
MRLAGRWVSKDGVPADRQPRHGPFEWEASEPALAEHNVAPRKQDVDWCRPPRSITDKLDVCMGRFGSALNEAQKRLHPFRELGIITAIEDQSKLVNEDRKLKLIERRVPVRIDKREAPGPFWNVAQHLVDYGKIVESGFEGTEFVLPLNGDHNALKGSEGSAKSLTPKAQSHSAALQNMCGAPTGAQARSARHRMRS